jgi:hypothetical protein
LAISTLSPFSEAGRAGYAQRLEVQADDRGHRLGGGTRHRFGSDADQFDAAAAEHARGNVSGILADAMAATASKVNSNCSRKTASAASDVATTAGWATGFSQSFEWALLAQVGDR